MPTLIEDLSRIEKDLAALTKKAEKPAIGEAIARGKKIVQQAHKAFCGSWLGYHACVYYQDMQPAPPGAHFSSEWGLHQARTVNDTRGNWEEFDETKVFDHLTSSVGTPSIKKMTSDATSIAQSCYGFQEEVESIIEACLARADDPYLQKLKTQVGNARIRPFAEYLAKYQPKGEIFSRDMLAMTAGVKTPPHFRLLAQLDLLDDAFHIPQSLQDVARRASSHLSKKESARGLASKQGNKVFIGHGGSGTWRELKDFVEDKLGLEIDEFNHKPVAGRTNTHRLSEMLNDAAIAFLIMTGEDERADGKKLARMNVIHEVGLFQGRLGFERAIVVLEEGCEAFSNIEGLGQIRFPPGKIKAAFQEVREAWNVRDF